MARITAPTLLFTFSLSLGAISGCRSEAPEPGASDATAAPDMAGAIPFRRDGTLAFLRDGQEITTIDVELAATDSARTRGLMDRTSLPRNSGMLFLFEQEEPQSFWMADTPLPLDIYFVSADSQIVNIAKYTRPNSPESVPSIDPAQYVVETQAGFADSHGIVEGDHVTWSVAHQ